MLKKIKKYFQISLIQLKNKAIESVVVAMSSGQYKPHRKFNPIQIKNGNVVRLRKDGTIKAVLGKYGEYNKKNK